jgi:DNA repair protein RecN (Recombination protein N)
MLRFLRIKRLAVIDSVEVEFAPGLNVLTGETGAGKSILVEAVGLLLGDRASGDLVRTGEDAATIEAIFETGGEELLVRREITAQGRSRAFVNDALATAGALKDLSGRLVELHGQREHQTLLDPSTHLELVDTFGRLDRLTAPVVGAFGRLSGCAEELARVKRAAIDRRARQDLVTFQLGELERAALKPAEDEELTARRQVLASAERVERLCAESYASLYESDQAVLSSLGHIWRRVAELAALDPRFQPFLDAREGVKSQLEDLALFLRRYGDTIEASPARLQHIEERLALLERLKRKYGPTLAEAIARRDALRRELSELEGSDERVAELERDHAAASTAYLTAAQALSSDRRRVAADFARQLERVAGELAMERTRFDVRFNEAPMAEPEWSARGIDRAEFFVTPNPGEELRPLARIASGGELSRIMLAIKTLTATSREGSSQTGSLAAASDAGGLRASTGAPNAAAALGWLDGVGARPRGTGAPGLIFDEVDAGIGGRAADMVGGTLRALGSEFQVLCITHLPQIAAFADTHFLIEKRVERGRTHTSVRRLDDAGRVEEIGRMLGGAAISEGLRASAREMLADRRQRPGSGSRQAKGESKSKGESERTKAKPPVVGNSRS